MIKIYIKITNKILLHAYNYVIYVKLSRLKVYKTGKRRGRTSVNKTRILCWSHKAIMLPYSHES